jgi:hypothetical protein
LGVGWRCGDRSLDCGGVDGFGECPAFARGIISWVFCPLEKCVASLVY